MPVDKKKEKNTASLHNKDAVRVIFGRHFSEI